MSRHRTATLDPTAAAPAGASGHSAAGPAGAGPGRAGSDRAGSDRAGSGRAGSRGKAPDGPNTTGSRSSRHKRGLLRRTGIIVPAIAIALAVVVVVTLVAYLLSPAGSGANSLEKALNSLPHSNSIARLEAERQQLIVMNAAAQTLSQASKPQVVNPSQVMASNGGNGGLINSSSTGGMVSLPPPDPGTAQHIAYQLLPSFGFSQATQWNCLEPLWQRESNWEYDAENPSGAYGIPQSLPGSKMASVAADWMTDPTTQIKWGLGYISQVYGTPCVAWQHEEADGWY